MKLAFVKTQSLIQNNSRKGKFEVETSFQKSSSPEEYVTTISIKEGGKTYEISVDCLGRTREVGDALFFKSGKGYCTNV